MYTTYVLTLASTKMFFRNRQALFFMILFPFIILFVFGSMNFGQATQLHVGIVTHKPNALVKQFIERVHSIQMVSTDEGPLEEELKKLKEGFLAAVVDVPEGFGELGGGAAKGLKVYLNEKQPMQAQAVMGMLEQFADKAALGMAGVKPLFTIEEEKVSAHQFRYVEFLLPGIIALGVMQMSVLSVVHVFAQYKEKGILKRLLATPMRPYQFVTANILTRLMMALMQSATFIVVGLWMYHVQVMGAYWLLGVCVVLGAVMFLGLGFAVSGLARTTEAVPVLANLIIMPMMLLGNVFFPTSSMPDWLERVAEWLPLTLFSDALRSVMTDGLGVMDIQKRLVGMLGWAVVLIAVATVTFRFQEKGE